jgi:hypothetical protein
MISKKDSAVNHVSNSSSASNDEDSDEKDDESPSAPNDEDSDEKYDDPTALRMEKIRKQYIEDMEDFESNTIDEFRREFHRRARMSELNKTQYDLYTAVCIFYDMEVSVMCRGLEWRWRVSE